MSNGVYLSKLKGDIEDYLWSFMIPSEEHPAHFGVSYLTNVISHFLEKDNTSWVFSESSSKFCVLPERVLRW